MHSVYIYGRIDVKFLRLCVELIATTALIFASLLPGFLMRITTILLFDHPIKMTMEHGMVRA